MRVSVKVSAGDSVTKFMMIAAPSSASDRGTCIVHMCLYIVLWVRDVDKYYAMLSWLVES